MLIDDLPRLSDEERELADDEYAVMPAAVPTNLSIDDLIARRTAALYAMKTAGDDFAAFSAASKEEAQLAVQIRRVRRDAAQAEAPVQSWICPTCKGSGLDPSEGSYCPTCEGTGSAPNIAAKVSMPVKRHRLSRLATLFVAAVTALGLTACSLTPTQKKWAGFAAGALVVGAIAAHDADNGKALASPQVRTPTVACSNPEACR